MDAEGRKFFDEHFKVIPVTIPRRRHTPTGKVERFVVTCEDGVVRHDAFGTRAAADLWTEWGHVCTKTHTTTAVEVDRGAL